MLAYLDKEVHDDNDMYAYFGVDIVVEITHCNLIPVLLCANRINQWDDVLVGHFEKHVGDIIQNGKTAHVKW